jgi:beta-lactam-binding protein with PASTA domain
MNVRLLLLGPVCALVLGAAACGPPPASPEQPSEDETAFVPDMLGDNAASAEAMLQTSEFSVILKDADDHPPRRCIVVDQDPPEGRVDLGAVVTLTVDCRGKDR